MTEYKKNFDEVNDDNLKRTTDKSLEDTGKEVGCLLEICSDIGNDPDKIYLDYSGLSVKALVDYIVNTYESWAIFSKMHPKCNTSPIIRGLTGKKRGFVITFPDSGRSFDFLFVEKGLCFKGYFNYMSKRRRSLCADDLKWIVLFFEEMKKVNDIELNVNANCDTFKLYFKKEV